MVAIAATSTDLVLWTAPSFEANFGFWFHVIGHSTVAVLPVEYVLRLWSTPVAGPDRSARHRRWRYALTSVDTIDAAALAPSAVSAGLPQAMG